MKLYKVAVAGATGMVGRKMIQVLEEREFPVGELIPLASSRSAGQKIKFKGANVRVEELTHEILSKTTSRSRSFLPAPRSAENSPRPLPCTERS